MSEEPGDDRAGDRRVDDGPSGGDPSERNPTDGDRSADEPWGGDRSEDDRWGDRSDDDLWGEDADAVDRDARGSEGDAAGSPDPEDDEEYEPSVAGVFGARPEDAPPRPEIVPESPDLENALFVLLGVLFGLFVIYRAVVVFSG